MPKVPTFIKPARLQDRAEELTSERVRFNAHRRITTGVVLDLNILNMMRRVVSDGRTLAEENLSSLVDFLNENSVSIVPGLALQEADKTHEALLERQYETFMSVHCPSYVNTPAADYDYGRHTKSRNFIELDETQQQYLLNSYLSILATHVVKHELASRSPEDRFAAYLALMDTQANLVSPLEAEVAKFCFFNRSELPDCAFRKSCKVIHDNFNKGGKGFGRLQYVLNAARDLTYLRTTAMMDGVIIDGSPLENWLLTSDQALVELSKSIYFRPHRGHSAKYAALARNPEQESSAYWNYCDQLFVSTMQRRQAVLTLAQQSADARWKGLFACRRDLEERVLAYWPDESSVEEVILKN